MITSAQLLTRRGAELKQARKQMLAALLQSRLENYGYEYKAFRRLQGQRQAAKRAVRLAAAELGAENLAWDKAPLAHRIDWENLSYTVGQSSNEEVTNLLRQLVNPEARWVS